MRKTAFLLATLATALLAGGPAAAQSSLDVMLKNRKLNVCWINYPPGGYRDAASGKFQGYYFEIINDILGQIKVEPNFVESEWATFVAALQARQCDISIGGTLMTVSRASVVGFSRPIFYLSSHLVVGKDNTTIKSLDDVKKTKGVRVVAVQGTSAHNFATRQFPDAQIVALASRDPTAPMLELASGRADASVSDAWLAEKFAREHPNTVKILTMGNTFNAEGVGWVFRKEDHELRNFFDVALEKLRLTGAIDAYVTKYPESGRYMIDDRIRPVK